MPKKLEAGSWKVKTMRDAGERRREGGSLARACDALRKGRRVGPWAHRGHGLDWSTAPRLIFPEKPHNYLQAANNHTHHQSPCKVSRPPAQGKYGPRKRKQQTIFLFLSQKTRSL